MHTQTWLARQLVRLRSVQVSARSFARSSHFSQRCCLKQQQQQQRPSVATCKSFFRSQSVRTTNRRTPRLQPQHQVHRHCHHSLHNTLKMFLTSTANGVTEVTWRPAAGKRQNLKYLHSSSALQKLKPQEKIMSHEPLRQHTTNTNFVPYSQQSLHQQLPSSTTAQQSCSQQPQQAQHRQGFCNKRPAHCNHTTQTFPFSNNNIRQHQQSHVKTATSRHIQQSRTQTQTQIPAIARSRLVPQLAPVHDNNKFAARPMSALVAVALVAACSLFHSPQVSVVAALSDSTAISTSSVPQQTTQELFVKPEGNIRLECKASGIRYWNFQSSDPSATSETIYFREENLLSGTPQARGFELKQDSDGTYDLYINNVSFDLHDGLFTCKNVDANIKISYKVVVLLQPQAPTLQTSAKTARDGQNFQLNCSSVGGNPAPNITWYRDNQVLTSVVDSSQTNYPSQLRIETERYQNPSTLKWTTSSILTWPPTVDDHQVSFKCSVSNKAMASMQMYESEFKMHVEYAPRISLGPFNPLKVLKGSSTTLNCLVDANPPVKAVQWFRDGVLLSSQFNYTLADVKPADAGLYACHADNGVAPSIAAQAAAGGSSSFVSSNFFLNALAGAGLIPGGGATPSTTVVANMQLSVLYSPRVQVKSSTASASQPLSEGDLLTLNCSADSSPPAYEFVWTKSTDSTFRRVSALPNFEFGAGVTANDMAVYTCTATNRLDPSNSAPFEKSSSGSHHVLVEHKPGVAELVAGTNGLTEVGRTTVLQCKARPPGFPEPLYRFSRVDNRDNKIAIVNKHGANYTIISAKQDDEARYSCQAFNAHGDSSEAEATLIVNEPPTIVDPPPLADERAPGYSGFLITAHASGKPAPRVQWFHRSPIDGRRTELGVNGAGGDHQKFTIETRTVNNRKLVAVHSTLKFNRPLSVSDRGLYSAEFSNGQSRIAQTETQLHIDHAPILVAGFATTPTTSSPRYISASPPTALTAPQSAPIFIQGNSIAIKTAFDLGETVSMSCRVSAFPKPEFDWYVTDNNSQLRKISELQRDSRYSFNVVNTRDDIWESTLSFTNAVEEDYGEYVCASANFDKGTKKLSDTVRTTITLVNKTTPDRPNQLEVYESAQNSVSLLWQPGFDGGFPAAVQYLVQFALEDGSGPLSQRVQLNAAETAIYSSSGNGLQQHGDDQTTQQQLTSSAARIFNCAQSIPCKISGLTPRQAYLFRVKARNELGESEFSEELRATTRANNSQIPKILDASFDKINNLLYYELEPGTDEFNGGNLSARIEAKHADTAKESPQSQDSSLLTDPAKVAASVMQPQSQQQSQSASWSADVHTSSSSLWKFVTYVPIIVDKQTANLDVPQDAEQLRMTLCSSISENICGPEFIVSIKSQSSLFSRDPRALSLPFLASTVCFILMAAALATTVHACCLSKREKKADIIERDNNRDSSVKQNGDSGANTGVSQKTGEQQNRNGQMTGVVNGGLQSMDSIVQGNSSDHSSDHSRQAKLDSMLPPNYNHYSDRASFIMDQQQQQVANGGHPLLGAPDKLSSPFGLLNVLGGGVGHQQQQQRHPSIPSPINNNLPFTYGTSTPAGSLLDAVAAANHQQAQLDKHQNTLNGHLDSMMTMNDVASSLNWMSQQQQHHHHQDDYNNYAYQNGIAAMTTDPNSTYGTTESVQQMLSAAANENLANYHQPYYYQQQHHDLMQQQQQQQNTQYQQEVAAAQQQMYSTLTRSGYSKQLPDGNTNSLSAMTDNNQYGIQQAAATNGLGGVQLPPPTLVNDANTSSNQTTQQQPPQESDYGTVGGRGGRVIREIIV